MKQHKLLVALLAAFMGVLFFSFNGNIKAKADDDLDWEAGVPDFLNNDNYMNSLGGEVSYDPDADLLTVDSSQNELHGDDLSYAQASKHIYYLYAANDDGGEDGSYQNLFKIKTLSGDRFKIYYQSYSYDSGNYYYSYWGTYTA